MYLQRRLRVPHTTSSIRLSIGMLLALGILYAGCAAFRVPEEPATPTPMQPVWSEQELREHIRFLNGSEISGRATGTQGYARAAAYVAARMKEFGLQPAVKGDYRIVYGASINYPISGALRVVGPSDSLDFLPGIDFLPDGRSDSGAVSISRLIVAGTNVEPAASPGGNFGIVVPSGETVDLQAWRKAGARIALVVDKLYPRFEPAPVRGIIAVQMTPRAAGQLLRIEGTSTAEYLAERRGEMIALGRTVYARVDTDFQTQAGAINIIGYFSGKHPVRREQIVVVCADLDAVGHFAGVTTMDFRNFGVTTSAVLEVARNLGFITTRWQFPERSVMVAVWSGSRLGHAGLRYFLEHPTWSLSDVESVVYVGLSAAEQTRVRELLGRYGIPLIAIPRSDARLYPEDVLLLPDPMLQRAARSRYEDTERLEEPTLSQLVDTAVVRAVDLAEKAYDRVMIETTTTRPFFPADEDSLKVPATDGID